MTSILNEDHRTAHHNQPERCNASYVLCNDNNCILKGKHMVCSNHPFHPGDRIINWEFKNKYGWVYYTKPNPVALNQIIYVKYDNDNNKIYARFGKCACTDIFLCTDCDRDVKKAKIYSKYDMYFPLDKLR